jgi:hypothetical protein
MKRITTLFSITAILTVFLTSCGTITGRLSKVALVDAPRNLSATADGERVDISRDLTVSNLKVGTNGDTYNDYYSPVVKLDKHKTVTLKLSSGGSSGSVDLKPKFSGNYLLGNLFLTGLTGTLVDVATGNHRQHIRFIDVPAVLAGKPMREWRSKHQLKKAIKRSAKGK